jgi:uncharacterized protein (DUF433 family)
MTLDRITMNPGRMNGQPSIRNLRLTVKRVIELLALYPDRAELRQEYPELEDEDIQQALTFAAARLEDQSVDFAL